MGGEAIQPPRFTTTTTRTTTMYLKTMHGFDQAPGDGNEHSVLADVVSCHFIHNDASESFARCWVREPVKTADVSGFVECERYVSLSGPAYLVGDNGKTVSRFMPRRAQAHIEPGFEMVQGKVTIGGAQ
jgi:hypothetical protein